MRSHRHRVAGGTLLMLCIVATLATSVAAQRTRWRQPSQQRTHPAALRSAGVAQPRGADEEEEDGNICDTIKGGIEGVIDTTHVISEAAMPHIESLIMCKMVETDDEEEKEKYQEALDQLHEGEEQAEEEKKETRRSLATIKKIGRAIKHPQYKRRLDAALTKITRQLKEKETWRSLARSSLAAGRQLADVVPLHGAQQRGFTEFLESVKNVAKKITCKVRDVVEKIKGLADVSVPMFFSLLKDVNICSSRRRRSLTSKNSFLKCFKERPFSWFKTQSTPYKVAKGKQPHSPEKLARHCTSMCLKESKCKAVVASMDSRGLCHMYDKVYQVDSLAHLFKNMGHKRALQMQPKDVTSVYVKKMNKMCKNARKFKAKLRKLTLPMTTT